MTLSEARRAAIEEAARKYRKQLPDWPLADPVRHYIAGATAEAERAERDRAALAALIDSGQCSPMCLFGYDDGDDSVCVLPMRRSAPRGGARRHTSRRLRVLPIEAVPIPQVHPPPR